LSDTPTDDTHLIRSGNFQNELRFETQMPYIHEDMGICPICAQVHQENIDENDPIVALACHRTHIYCKKCALQVYSSSG
jgi:hypothetical protein